MEGRMVHLPIPIHEGVTQYPSLLPAVIHTMTLAYRQICAGEDPWTALGNFTNAWYGYAKHMRTDLVKVPLVKPEQDTEHTRRWGAFCAASIEFLCERYHVSCPDWVYDPCYILETPWWYAERFGGAPMREHIQKTTPAPFIRRNIFCSNRLFQNKYELFEWMQEARAKGMTDSRDIWRYMHQKEEEFHGA